MIFNHESPTHSHLFRDGCNDDHYYICDDFKMFRARYRARIENWYKQLQTYSKITLVYQPQPGMPTTTQDQVETILRVFRSTYPKNTFSLILAWTLGTNPPPFQTNKLKKRFNQESQNWGHITGEGGRPTVTCTPRKPLIETILELEW